MHKRGWLVVVSLSLLLASGCRRSDKTRIGVVPKAVAHVFWQSVHAGAVAAGREADVDIDWIGPPKETDFSRQIEIVDAMINSRVDGIVLAPTEATALVNVVERAGKTGIPVAIFDSGINTEQYVSFRLDQQLPSGRARREEAGRASRQQGQDRGGQDGPRQLVHDAARTRV